MSKQELTTDSNTPLENNIDVQDFLLRWKRARIAALQSVLRDPASPKDSPTPGISDTDVTVDEHFILKNVPPEKHAECLKEVFNNSRKLGMSALRFFNLAWDPEDLELVARGLPTPCFKGPWATQDSARVLQRKACDLPGSHGTFACDYWRESLDGLATHVLADHRYSRYKCQPRGDSQCEDVLWPEEQKHLQWGPLPAGLEKTLRAVEERLIKKAFKATLEILGFSEGTLYYFFESKEMSLCGAVGRMSQHSFETAVKKEFPNISFKYAAPSAVILDEK